MSLGPGALKLAGGLGALLVCGGAGVTVAADQRPAGAPLNPPVSHGSAAPAATASVASGGGLVIPPTPVCAGTPPGPRRAGAACRGAGSGATSGATALTPSVSEAGPSGEPLAFSYVS